jgi:hypothetical protein
MIATAMEVRTGATDAAPSDTATRPIPGVGGGAGRRRRLGPGATPRARLERAQSPCSALPVVALGLPRRCPADEYSRRRDTPTATTASDRHAWGLDRAPRDDGARTATSQFARQLRERSEAGSFTTRRAASQEYWVAASSQRCACRGSPHEAAPASHADGSPSSAPPVST